MSWPSVHYNVIIGNRFFAFVGVPSGQGGKWLSLLDSERIIPNHVSIIQQYSHGIAQFPLFAV